jgi:hypothetical protein
MSIENKLLRYKKDLEETQSKIDQEKGALKSVFDSLREVLITVELDEKLLIKEAQKKIGKLKTDNDDLEDELEALMEEIEGDLE